MDIKTTSANPLTDEMDLLSLGGPGVPLEPSGEGEQFELDEALITDNFEKKDTRSAETDTSTAAQELAADTENDKAQKNSTQFWCQRCGEMRAVLCPTHGMPNFICDKPIPSRAMASLPSGLKVTKICSDDMPTQGVFTKRIIPVNSIFGPIVAPETEQKLGTDFPLMVHRDSKTAYIEYGDEDKCNWMMFVRPVKNGTDMNLMVFEYNHELYYVSTKSIPNHQELRVGYSPPYAELYDLPLIAEELPVIRCEPCGIYFDTHIAKVGHCRSHKCKANDGKSKKKGRPRKYLITDVQQVQPIKQEAGITSGNDKTDVSKRSGVRSRRRCPECNVGFDQKELMDLHMVSHTSQREEPSQQALEDKMIQEEVNVSQSADDKLCAADNDGVIIKKGCPSCSESFSDMPSLFKHLIDEHSKRVAKSTIDPNSYGASESDLVIDVDFDNADIGRDIDFESANPMNVDNVDVDTKTDHGYGANTNGFTCQECGKVIGSMAALFAHKRSHERKKYYYSCFICDQTFLHSKKVLEHVKTHAVDGIYYCPKCPNRWYEDWKKCRKHVKSLHSGREYPCVECGKVFSRPEKLRIHVLTHTDVKDFMCDTCGKQFSRKDKLVEHIRKVHSMGESRIDETVVDESKRFKPKVPSSDYHRFIYKCLDCSLGFKRRGMLINHLAKFHPSVALSSIPELNLPLLRTQKEYYCLHCSRVYKSNTKRKMHILRCHPGCPLPPSLKNKDDQDLATFSQTVGSITTFPYACEHCHKQYANKAKLTEHKRAKHQELFMPNQKTLLTTSESRMNEDGGLSSHDVVTLLQPMGGAGEPVAISLQGINLEDATRVDNSDLLTHAMSVNELQPSLDFNHQNVQTQHLTSNTNHMGIPSGALEFRILPNSSIGIDFNSLQMTSINNQGITFAVPSTSISLGPPMQQNMISNSHITPNLNSTASSTSPRSCWPYQFKLN